jgi:hypothetical protein
MDLSTTREVPSIAIFHFLGCLFKESVQIRGSMEFFVTNLILTSKGC